jgi:hypothetical protein
MASPRPPSLAQATHYRLPELLHDIRLLDLLQLSQPTISRRYRIQAEDFGLVRDRRQLWGCGYGTSAAMRLLLAGCPWLLPTPQRFRAAANWLELVLLVELPLALGFCPEAPALVGAVPEVLVPDRGVAPGLRRRQPADPRRLDQADPWQRPGPGGGGSGGTHLGFPAPGAPGLKATPPGSWG